MPVVTQLPPSPRPRLWRDRNRGQWRAARTNGPQRVIVVSLCD